jgi:hypothetical protein
MLAAFAALCAPTLYSPPAAALAVPAVATEAPSAYRPLMLAQAGSTGGSIGKQDKSISGGYQAPASSRSSGRKHAERHAPAHRPVAGGDQTSASSRSSGRKHAERDAPAAAPAHRPAAGGSADGAWSVTADGCGGSATLEGIISAGRFISDSGKGTVSRDGSAQGVAHVLGGTAIWSGRFSGRSGSGTFRRTDGCVGHWSSVKQ